jgi:tetratricopeptide (TPR) repeat protein
MYRLGNTDAADRAAHRAVELGEQCGDSVAVATGYNYLANQHNAEGRADQARQCLVRSRQLWRELGDERGVLVCQVNLSDVSLAAKDYDNALAEATEALEVARRFGDPDITSVAAINAAIAALALDRPTESAEFCREALELAQGAGDLAAVGCGLLVTASLAVRAGALEAAARITGLEERLRADLELDPEPAEKALQEQLMRDLAALGSDRLRTEMAAGAAMDVDDLVRPVLTAGDLRP